MPWIQLKLQAPGKLAPEIEDALQDLGAVAVTLQDSGDQPLFEPPPGATPIWDDTTLTALFEADANVDIAAAALKSTANTTARER